METKIIISKFGGVRPLAKLLGYPATTVQNWITRNCIPSKQQQQILKVGVQHGIDICADSFFPDFKPKKPKSTKTKN